MNAPVTFNTLAFVRKLEASGMEVQQAEAPAEALSEIVFDTTATKSDLRELELRLSNALLVKLGTAIAASTALVVAILGALITWHH